MTTDLQARLEQALADVLVLQQALLKSCSLCHGSGTYWPDCDRCRDSTDDHDCPPKVTCTHPYTPELATKPHPGSALLREVLALRPVLEAAREVVREVPTFSLADSRSMDALRSACAEACAAADKAREGA